MALSSNDINAVVESIVHGSEEKYVAELIDTIISEFERGLMYSAEVDLYTLARTYPAKASAILIKYKDQINEEVLNEIQTALNASVADDLASLASVYGMVQAAEYTTDHFKEISRQTAEGVRQIIERQNVALSQSLQDTWYKVSADAVTAINHGLKPRSQVLAEGVVKLMDAGISVVPYQRGGKRTVTNHVDVALRRHITTQVSQAGGRMSLEAMDLYGHDLVITDAHYGARPEHAEWQGIPCSRTGRKTINGVTYPDLVMFTGYGSVTGLKGANCRHMIFAYYPGISRLPDREFKAHEAKFGKTSEEYYQATQRQRELERRIRKTKREIAGLEKAGVGLENPVYVQKRLVLGKQQKTIKQFCKENKLTRLYERERAYGIGAQPRALRASSKKLNSILESRKKILAGKHVDKLAGVPRGTPMTFDDANGGRVNPGFSSGKVGYYINCQSCVVAFEARLRGYDVIAKPYNKDGVAAELAMYANIAYRDPKTGASPPIVWGEGVNTPKRILKFLEDNVEDDCRYSLSFSLDIETGNGHIVNIFRNQDGNLRIYDPQSGKIYEDRKLRDYIKTFKIKGKVGGLQIERPIGLLRVDNMDFNKLIVEQVVESAR